jgi:hypothetical protein
MDSARHDTDVEAAKGRQFEEMSHDLAKSVARCFSGLDALGDYCGSDKVASEFKASYEYHIRNGRIALEDAVEGLAIAGGALLAISRNTDTADTEMAAEFRRLTALLESNHPLF